MEHGLTGYVRHKCRCDICKAAKKAAAARDYAKNRAARLAKNSEWEKANRDRCNAAWRRWADGNPEERIRSSRERSKRYADANRDAVRARYRAWLSANPEKAKEADLRYRKANPQKARDAAKRRRARLAGADMRSVSERDWQRLCARYHYCCAYCGERVDDLHKDHVIPITRGGRHAIGNILPACKPCNSSKNNRLPIEWRGRRNDLATQ